MSDDPIKKPRRELRGLLDQHSRNTQNNTVAQPEPIVTPFLSNQSTNQQSRKRKLDRALLDSVTCETVAQVLG
jgi:hypothetical protein